jgi:hypothetical protein
MSFTRGEPPGPHAGDTSPVTRELRPAVGLSPAQCHAARRMRRKRHEISQIAATLESPEEAVRQALATLRTPKPSASRRSLNVTLAAHEFVWGEAEPHEACWETVDRLLVELAYRRAFDGVRVSRGEPPKEATA